MGPVGEGGGRRKEKEKKREKRGKEEGREEGRRRIKNEGKDDVKESLLGVMSVGDSLHGQFTQRPKHKKTVLLQHV